MVGVEVFIETEIIGKPIIAPINTTSDNGASHALTEMGSLVTIFVDITAVTDLLVHTKIIDSINRKC